jgi:hypothetical protein
LSGFGQKNIAYINNKIYKMKTFFCKITYVMKFLMNIFVFKILKLYLMVNIIISYIIIYLKEYKELYCSSI